MRIAFDAKRLFNNFTGLGNYSRNIVNGLMLQHPEHEYLLYTPKLRNNPETQPFIDSATCHVIMPQGLVRGGLWRTYGLASQLSNDGIDLYHGLSNEIPVGLSRKHIPSIVTMHDVAYHTFPAMYHWIDRQLYDAKYGYACRHASHIVAISESTRQDVMRFYDIPEERISVICQPVQQLFYHPLSEVEAQRIVNEALPDLTTDFCLYVGSINSRKNLLSAIKALELLPASRRPLLLVVGNGREYRREVEQYIATHQLSSYVRIESGIRSNLVLQALYSRALFFIYPSFYEGFGLPVVEATLQRCPVITSNVSSLPEAAGQSALLVDPTSVDSLHAALLTLLDNREHASQIGQECHDYALSHFSPEKLAEQMHNLYNRWN